MFCRTARSRRSPTPKRFELLRRRRRVADIFDDHGFVSKTRGDFERAAKRLYVAAQVADMHIRALFHFRDGGLTDGERCGDVLLRELARRSGVKPLASSLKGRCPVMGSTPPF